MLARLFGHRHSDTSRRVALDVESAEFHLALLPKPALSLVLQFLPIRDAAQLARTCKLFHGCFRDETVWKLRCIGLEKGILFKTWFHCFASSSWKIVVAKIMRINSMVERGRRKGEVFSVTVNAAISMTDFVRLLLDHPSNWKEKRDHSKLQYQPYDVRKIGMYVGPFFKLSEPIIKPNCQMRMEAKTVYESGLCHGAIIEQEDLDSCYD
jgi:hypothetical protein